MIYKVSRYIFRTFPSTFYTSIGIGSVAWIFRLFLLAQLCPSATQNFHAKKQVLKHLCKRHKAYANP